MFSTFFRFELNFWLRGMMVYVFMFILGLLVFGATASDNVQIGRALENSHRNAPFVIQYFYSIMSLLTCLMTVAFVDGAACRDFNYHTHEIVFTKPLNKLSYLMGRFWGATLVSIIPMLGISLGVIVAGWMPWIEAEQWGPIDWRAHLWSIVVFAIPNSIFIAAIVFAIATITRSTIASFLGALLLLVGYLVAQNLVGDLDNETIAIMLDPFGIRAFSSATKYWTVAEMNTLVVTLQGWMLWNRLLWLSVGMGILGLTCWRFSFAQRLRTAKRPTPIVAAPAITAEIPHVHFHHGIVAQLRQLGSQVRIDFFETIKSNVFIVIMAAALLNTGASLMVSASAGFGLSSLPVTYNIIDIVRGTMYIFLLAVIVFYAGVLVWKERDAKFDEVYDALPQPIWIAYLGKLIALTLLVVLVLCVGMTAGVATQAYQGYTRFQFGLYLRELLVLDLTEFFCLLVLALFIHVVSPHKYMGYFLFFVVVIANTFAWRLVDVETRMVRFGSLPPYTYSDLFHFAPYTQTLFWFAVYWLLFTVLMSLVAILFWQRGRETGFGIRSVLALERWTGPLRWVTAVALLAWFTTAAWLFYNTKVLNEFQTTKQVTKRRADYEKEFKAKHENVPQPRISSVKYDIDIYPARRGLELRGVQTIENRSDRPIDKLFIATADNYETELEIERTTLAESYEDWNYYVYQINPPLAVGEALQMSYTVKYQPVGFENSVSNTGVVQNGTFFNNTIVPQIGYQTGQELASKKDRKKHGLGPPKVMPDLDPLNLAARANTYISQSSDWVDVETVISTSADQIAVAPGSLLKKWEAAGRRYYHYKVDHPSLNFYSFISADYEVAFRKWNDVDIEVYYHPEHRWNVDNMLRSIRRSLEYYTEHFGPYRHKQARIIEFPRVAEFAQAFPGTMPYSEGIGFIADIKDDDDIDMVFYVVAHEMAHQWWAHQVIGANMQGATLLSETLAQYSALMVMEKEFGRDIMRKFLKYEIDRYLGSRGRELLDERPLVRVESSQGYVHYRKGSAVMYYLKEMIGEDKINAALRQVADKFAYQPAPYPTSMDLVDALRAQTPTDLQYLINDLFEEITLFTNRTLQARYQETDDGKFAVELEIECQKAQADGQGAEADVPLDDWIEIGAFATPEPGKEYGETLYRERCKITQQKNIFKFVVDRQPHQVGVDPFSLLIDRQPDDNMKKPTRIN